MEKKVNVVLIEDLNSLSDSALNKLVSIRDTDYNRNVRYGKQTKKHWKQLYENTGVAHMSISEIASSWGCSVNTVRRAVDPAYDKKVKEANAVYNRKYNATHTQQYNPEYKADLIARKREMVSGLAHLKTL